VSPAYRKRLVARRGCDVRIRYPTAGAARRRVKVRVLGRFQIFSWGVGERSLGRRFGGEGGGGGVGCDGDFDSVVCEGLGREMLVTFVRT
jgi:hypothetical protein